MLLIKKMRGELCSNEILLSQRSMREIDPDEPVEKP